MEFVVRPKPIKKNRTEPNLNGLVWLGFSMKLWLVRFLTPCKLIMSVDFLFKNQLKQPYLHP